MTDRSTGGNARHEDLRFVEHLRAALVATTVLDAVAAPAAPDRLLEMIVRAAARVIPCPEGALMLVDRQREVLTFDVVIGSTAETVRELTVPLGHGVAGLVAVSGQALAIANAQDDPRHARDIAERSGYLPTTILAVPVVARDGAPAGVLELLDRQGQPTFDLDDMDLLGAFAEQVAVVLELRRLRDSIAARVGAAMASLGGLTPDAGDALADLVETLVARVEGDEESRRADELAGLVAAIARRGEAEHEACVAVLRAFAGYLGSRPTLGMESFGLESFR